ncbi:hypothetical protein GALMADRAFT_1135482 [Galerina marginata CBS 339.88]|uniref:Uncharacterized protein n=1 Tax=Galerina marginata (strain CBS 339.88) TaxID=685588 RepID=A0A067SGN3_GALM3|nr:hypothetical protein GALMADRAFT_1135482 [Galerina marginata CBS 339.88]
MQALHSYHCNCTSFTRFIVTGPPVPADGVFNSHLHYKDNRRTLTGHSMPSSGELFLQSAITNASSAFRRLIGCSIGFSQQLTTLTDSSEIEALPFVIFLGHIHGPLRPRKRLTNRHLDRGSIVGTCTATPSC